MGSKGEKRSRQGRRREHLPKVGSRDEVLEEQHLERQSIAEVMGLGRSRGFWWWVVAIVVVILVILAAVSLAAL
jgi:hypothetical protein